MIDRTSPPPSNDPGLGVGGRTVDRDVTSPTGLAVPGQLRLPRLEWTRIVYVVSRRPELVAKIQKYALSRHDIDKLDVLVRAATPELLLVAAWPTDLLKTRNGQVVGYVMPRILDARPLCDDPCRKPIASPAANQSR
jgi:DNA-binding helix-hairpin-helix protein with protein kinase domain